MLENVGYSTGGRGEGERRLSRRRQKTNKKQTKNPQQLAKTGQESQDIIYSEWSLVSERSHLLHLTSHSTNNNLPFYICNLLPSRPTPPTNDFFLAIALSSLSFRSILFKGVVFTHWNSSRFVYQHAPITMSGRQVLELFSWSRWHVTQMTISFLNSLVPQLWRHYLQVLQPTLWLLLSWLLIFMGSFSAFHCLNYSAHHIVVSILNSYLTFPFELYPFIQL